MENAKITTDRRSSLFTSQYGDTYIGYFTGLIIDYRLWKDHGGAAVVFSPVFVEAPLGHIITLHKGWIEAQGALPASSRGIYI